MLAVSYLVPVLDIASRLAAPSSSPVQDPLATLQASYARLIQKTSPQCDGGPHDGAGLLARLGFRKNETTSLQAIASRARAFLRAHAGDLMSDKFREIGGHGFVIDELRRRVREQKLGAPVQYGTLSKSAKDCLRDCAGLPLDTDPQLTIDMSLQLSKCAKFWTPKRLATWAERDALKAQYANVTYTVYNAVKKATNGAHGVEWLPSHPQLLLARFIPPDIFAKHLSDQYETKDLFMVMQDAAGDLSLKSRNAGRETSKLLLQPHWGPIRKHEDLLACDGELLQLGLRFMEVQLVVTDSIEASPEKTGALYDFVDMMQEELGEQWDIDNVQYVFAGRDLDKGTGSELRYRRGIAQGIMMCLDAGFFRFESLVP